MSANGRYLHTMLRVGNLDRAIKFYVDMFGMKELRRWDVPDGKFTNAFVGYGDEDSNCVLEFTYNYGVEKYEIGTAYGHIAIGVPDVAAKPDAGVAASAPPSGGAAQGADPSVASLRSPYAALPPDAMWLDESPRAMTPEEQKAAEPGSNSSSRSARRQRRRWFGR